MTSYAVLLDFDGTVVNSMPLLEMTASSLITQGYGVDLETAVRRYRETAGAPFDVQLEEIFPGHQLNPSVAGSFRATKRRLYRHAPLFPDVRSALEELRAQGVDLVVCSSTVSDLVCDVLFREAVLHLVNVRGNRQGDDKTDQLRLVGYDKVLFVGDTRRDADYARRAGVEFLGVVRTFSEQDFRRWGIPCVTDLREVLPWLRR